MLDEEEIISREGLKVVKYVSNYYNENTYIILTRNQAIIVDPGFDMSNKHVIDIIIKKLLKNIDSVAIFNTHGHLDHTAANLDFKGRLRNVEIMIHRADAYLLEDYTEHELIKTALGLYDYDPDLFGHRRHSPDRLLKDGDTIKIDNYRFTLVHTPGHTMGSSILYSPDLNIAITGDTILEGTIGRVDLPHSNPKKMYESILKVNNILNDSTLVLPGHGNPFRFGLIRNMILREIEILISQEERVE